MSFLISAIARAGFAQPRRALKPSSPDAIKPITLTSLFRKSRSMQTRTAMLQPLERMPKAKSEALNRGEVIRCI
jgi:hypothetical protein